MAILASLIVLGASLASASQADLCDTTEVIRQLEQRSTADQAARTAWSNSKGSPETEAAVLAIDADNRAWFRPLLEQCGWPKVSVVGENGARSAWLMAQHADMDSSFQVFAAEKMKLAVLDGEASGKRLALLVDRNRRLQNSAQVYGMQFNVVDNAIVFLPIEDPGQLEARRREIGLEPFACWVDATANEKELPVAWPAGVPHQPADCAAPVD